MSDPNEILYLLLAVFTLVYLVVTAVASWQPGRRDWVYHAVSAPFVLVLGILAVLIAGMPGLIGVAVVHAAVSFRLLTASQSYAPAPDAHLSEKPLFRIEERPRDDGPGRHRRS